jgi:hypothetical protein
VLAVDGRPGAGDPVRTVGDVTWNEPVGPSNVMVHRRLVAAVADTPDGGPASWALAALTKDAMSIGRLDAVDHFVAGRGETVTKFGTRACPDGAASTRDSGFWRDFTPSITADGVFVATTRLSLRLEDGTCVPSTAVPSLRFKAMDAIEPPHGFHDRPSTSRDGRLVAMALAPPPPITAPGVPRMYNSAGTRYEVWVWRLPIDPPTSDRP